MTRNLLPGITRLSVINVPEVEEITVTSLKSAELIAANKEAANKILYNILASLESEPEITVSSTKNIYG